METDEKEICFSYEARILIFGGSDDLDVYVAAQHHGTGNI